MARKWEIPDDGKQNSKATDRGEKYGDKAEARPRDSVASRAAGPKPPA